MKTEDKIHLIAGSFSQTNEKVKRIEKKVKDEKDRENTERQKVSI